MIKQSEFYHLLGSETFMEKGKRIELKTDKLESVLENKTKFSGVLREKQNNKD